MIIKNKNILNKRNNNILKSIKKNHNKAASSSLQPMGGVVVVAVRAEDEPHVRKFGKNSSEGESAIIL